jgi:hypothetical protein
VTILAYRKFFFVASGGLIPRLKTSDQAVAAVMPVADVKGINVIQAWKAYYAAGKE